MDSSISQAIKNAKDLESEHGIYVRFKRVFDVLTAACCLVVFALPGLLIALAIKLDSKGPILFRQERMGKGCVPFICYKFRSMHIHAPKNCTANALANRSNLTTRVGAFLRKTSLDEMPQLINVLKGEMSLIGPRPLIMREQWINDQRRLRGVYQLRPGMTGLAQINGRNNVSDEEKLRYDTTYLTNYSFQQDVNIFFKTISYVLLRKDIL